MTGAICRSQLDSSIVAMMPTARHIRAVVLAYALAHELDYGSMSIHRADSDRDVVARV